MQPEDRKLELTKFGDDYLITGDVIPWISQMKALRLGAKSTDNKMRVSGYLFKGNSKNALQKLTDFVNRANRSMGYFTPSPTNLIDPQGVKYQIVTYNIVKPYVGQRVFIDSPNFQYQKVVQVYTGLEGFINKIMLAPLEYETPRVFSYIIDGKWQVLDIPIIRKWDFSTGSYVVDQDKQNATLRVVNF